MIKYKKQFRLYDIYRYAATGVESKIKGVHSYEVNRDATVMTVRFGDYEHSKIYFASNEAELKDIVRSVNKDSATVILRDPEPMRANNYV